jgi:hypothetical protein
MQYIMLYSGVCQVAVTCLEMACKSFVLEHSLKRLIIYSYITLVLGLAIYEPTLLGQIQAPTIKDYSSMCGICKMALYYIDSTILDLTKSFVYSYANVQWAVTIL